MTNIAEQVALAFEYEQARLNEAKYERQRKALRDKLMPLLGDDPVEGEVDSYSVRVVAVRPQGEEIDERGLYGDLVSGTWNKIAPRRVDPELLARAVERKQVSAKIVAKHTRKTFKTPYPTVTLGAVLLG